MLNRSGESRYPYPGSLAPDLREKAFSFSTLSMTLAGDLLYLAFIMARYVSSILSLLSIYAYVYFNNKLLHYQKRHIHSQIK